MDLIVKIATKSGLDFNTILSYEKPRVKPINAKDTWEKRTLPKRACQAILIPRWNRWTFPDDMRKNYIDDLEIGIMSKFVKPTVAIVGSLGHREKHSHQFTNWCRKNASKMDTDHFNGSLCKAH